MFDGKLRNVGREKWNEWIIISDKSSLLNVLNPR